MIYHTLLIPLDHHLLGYRSLYGCVNDIDALEELLLGKPGVGISAAQMWVTRLAATQFSPCFSGGNIVRKKKVNDRAVCYPALHP